MTTEAAQLHPVVAEVTARIVARSSRARAEYLAAIDAARPAAPTRTDLGCSNLAHGFAGCSGEDRLALRGAHKPGVAIISAYNDMLSAHQPLDEYPAWIKDSVRGAGGVAQFAGGVPAMCDGITQGRAGMELSLFSRDVIAMATAIALSHDMFDAALLLGVCDKIVPGLLIGALSFGHLPAILVPAGPMASGLPNGEKAKVRQRYATGRRDPRGTARRRVRVVPLAGHLHLLRHGQLQPARRRGDGPAPAGHHVRLAGHAAAQGDHRGGGPTRGRAVATR